MRTARTRHLRRLDLQPVVVELPRLLADRFGSAEHYSRDQVCRTLDCLGLRPGMAPFAYAAACTVEEFTRGMPAESLNDYLRMRDEIMRLFWLGHRSFTMDELRRCHFSPSSAAGASASDCLGEAGAQA